MKRSERGRRASRFDPLIRLLGGDPAVFLPVARAHRRMAERRARFVRGGSRGLLSGLTPFQTRCVMTFAISLATIGPILSASAALVGVVVALTLGAGFLLLIVALDHFDLLVDRNEYLVIAPHPHDDWSMLLAKLAVFTRTTWILGTCLFVAPSVAAAYTFRSVWAGFALLAGGYGVTFTVAWGAVLLTAAAVATGGYRATNRILPWVQTAYLALYLGFFSSRRFLSTLVVPDLRSLGALPWLLPTAWFAAPLEVASGHATPAAFVRGGMALALMGGIVLAGSGWISRRFGERMLEPAMERAPQAPAPPATPEPSAARTSRAAASRRAKRRTAGTGASRAFDTLFKAHLKGDHVFRMQFVSMIFVPAVIVISSATSGSTASVRTPEGVTLFAAMAIAFMLSIGTAAMTRSSHPSRIWCVLTSPASREAFSMAPVRMFRLVIVLPAVILLAAFSLWRGTGPLPWRPLPALAAGFVWEDVLVFLRGFTPTLPFSLPFKSVKRTGWLRLLLGLSMLLVLGFAILLLGLASIAGTAGYLGLIGLLTVVRLALHPWVLHRLRREAARLEPEGWAA